MYMPGYPLKGSMKAIRVGVEHLAEGGSVPLTTHHDAVVFLPDTVDAPMVVTSQVRAEVTFRPHFRLGTLPQRRNSWITSFQI
jgi:hypothetical protein